MSQLSGHRKQNLRRQVQQHADFSHWVVFHDLGLDPQNDDFSDCNFRMAAAIRLIKDNN